ncbi:MAG: helicase-related protein [Gemmatimonadales bacterium]
MPTIAACSSAWSRVLAESLRAPDEPLAFLVAPGPETPPAIVCRAAARALLDLTPLSPRTPPWLAAHQVPACERLLAILARYGGAVLADAVGLGKSFVALAAAQGHGTPCMLVVPAVLVLQWRALLHRIGHHAGIITHEALSRGVSRPRPPVLPAGTAGPARLLIVDEAHRFRNPGTRRYCALARLAIGARVLLVTATPVHNRPADLLHLLRLFLRDDALVALGVPSLSRAAKDGDQGPSVAAAVARLVVARSRRRIVAAWPGLRFPTRGAARTIHAAPAEPERVVELTDGIARLEPPGNAAALFRLTLLRRLASSVPALRETLRRYEAFWTVALDAATVRRRVTRRDFRRMFPMADEADLQLAFLPLLLEATDDAPADPSDLDLVRRLLGRAGAGPDPKADALARLLAAEPAKTIVFTDAAATVRHLRLRLAGTFRVGAVAGTAAWLGRDRAPRHEVLEAFAPRAFGVAPPHATTAVDVLLATDLLGEGLNLQDAERVIHYDLPWSPARLAQRVGRIDRLASPHVQVTTATFLPPEPLAGALAVERRLALKLRAQLAAGAAEVETVRGRSDADAPLDWCDRLQRLAATDAAAAPVAAAATVASDVAARVLIVRLGDLVEAIVVEQGEAVADASRATTLLERAVVAMPLPLDTPALSEALRLAAPLIRERLGGIAAARWRAADRDRVGRRLIPWVLVAARRAARVGDAPRLARLDALVARLAGGLTAGEALLLEELLARRSALDIRHLLAWHERLPPLTYPSDPPAPELVAAVVLK